MADDAQPAFIEPGEIVTARVVDFDSLEKFRQHPDGKARPAVIIENERASDNAGRPYTDRWRVMGLTTLATYANGQPRVINPQPMEDGVASYLWGERPALVPARVIDRHIGWATNELVDAIMRLTGRTEWQIEPMRPHAREDRRRARKRR